MSDARGLRHVASGVRTPGKNMHYNVRECGRHSFIIDSS